jgi:hypothetical protein
MRLAEPEGAPNDAFRTSKGQEPIEVPIHYREAWCAIRYVREETQDHRADSEGTGDRIATGMLTQRSHQFVPTGPIRSVALDVGDRCISIFVYSMDDMTT